MTEPLVGGNLAAPLSMRATAVVASAVIRAARQLLTDLERGRRVDAAVLRSAMLAAFRASDATGGWSWKIAYEACEAATVLLLRRYRANIHAKARSSAVILPMLTRVSSLFPTVTHRTEGSESLSQFSAILDDALDQLYGHHAVLVINERSGYAVMRIPASKFMLDDDKVDRHAKLIGPIEQQSVSLMSNSQRGEAGHPHFAGTWLAERAEIAEFKESAICVAAGVLLPNWKRLSNASTRAYRPRRDIGGQIIRCKVPAAAFANPLAVDPRALIPAADLAALMEGRIVPDLAEGIQLCRVRDLGAHLVERVRLHGRSPQGLRKRGMFVSPDASGVFSLAKLLDHSRFESDAERGPA